MASALEVVKGSRVFGSAGEYVGTVEAADGAELRLTDCPFTQAGGLSLPLGWVEHADGFVRLDRSRPEVLADLRVVAG